MRAFEKKKTHCIPACLHPGRHPPQLGNNQCYFPTPLSPTGEKNISTLEGREASRPSKTGRKLSRSLSAHLFQHSSGSPWPTPSEPQPRDASPAIPCPGAQATARHDAEPIPSSPEHGSRGSLTRGHTLDPMCGQTNGPYYILPAREHDVTTPPPLPLSCTKALQWTMLSIKMLYRASDCTAVDSLCWDSMCRTC